MDEHRQECHSERDESRYVLGTMVSWKSLERKLQNALNTNASFGGNVKVELLGEGQGFMSVIGRLTPDWSCQEEILPKSVILKIPSGVNARKYIESTELENMMENMMDREECQDREAGFKLHAKSIKMVHNTETAFYEVVRLLNWNIKVPKGYVLEYVSDDDDSDSLIVMQDFPTARVAPIFENITVSECAEALAAVAEVHALSLKDDEWKNRSRPTTLKQLFDINTRSPKVMRKMSQLVLQLDNERLGKFANDFDKAFDEAFNAEAMENLHIELGIRPVLVHGDLWSANVIWTTENGRRKLAALIDWQLTHPGCAAEDIARFICSFLSAKDRKNHTDELLTRYYESMETSHGDKLPFTLQQVRDSFKRVLPFQAAALLPTLGPFILHHVKVNRPEMYEATRKVMVEKAAGLLEDIFHYYHHRRAH